MDWSMLFSTVVGGAISALTAAVVLLVTERSNFERAEKQRIQVSAARARLAFHRLVEVAGRFSGIDATFSHNLSLHSEKLSNGMSPSQVIGTVFLSSDSVPRIDLEDVMFLFPNYFELWERIRNLEGVLERDLGKLREYKASRKEFDNFAMSVGGSVKDGMYKIETEDKTQRENFRAHVFYLDSILSPLIESTRKEKLQAIALANELRLRADEVFGSAFGLGDFMVAEENNANP